ncbi:MAG: F0F1 ATP synthase subunit B [Oscillospiraceae bacterium]|nr:F0F1 ATP synthase subunit B [Oscillospiraceae bacterium]
MENMNLLATVSTIGDVRELFGIDPSTIVLTLVNTLLILIAYRVFMHKPVMKILEKRKDAVNAEINAANEAKTKAEAAEKEYLALLADSKAEANKIISAAMAKARVQEEEIIAEAKESAVQIRQKAEEEIERERKRAVNEIKNQITEIVIMAAGKVAEKEISESDNAALIESFLVNAGD